MSERHIRITWEDQQIVGTPQNLELFTFAEPNQAMNHVFITQEQDAERVRGLYIFAHRAAYEMLAAFIRDNRYPRHEDLRHVYEWDVKVFEEDLAELMGDIDTPPEDWNS
jgi:hypothetical protein